MAEQKKRSYPGVSEWRQAIPVLVLAELSIAAATRLVVPGWLAWTMSVLAVYLLLGDGPYDWGRQLAMGVASRWRSQRA